MNAGALVFAVCEHGCGRPATVQHADGTLLCRACYEAVVGVSAGNPPCPVCYPAQVADDVLVAAADLAVVCKAATAQAARLRWLGFTNHVAEAADIEAAVARLQGGAR